MAEIQLGKRYRDAVTGFIGTATARHEYMFGCVRYDLEAEGHANDEVKAFVFDEQRLVALDEGVVKPTATSGGARPASPRTGP